MTQPTAPSPAAGPSGSLLAGPVVTPEQILAARDARVDRRRRVHDEHPGATLVCITLVVPGPVKTSARLEALRDEAIGAVAAMCAQRGWPVLATAAHDAATGPEGVVVTQAPPDDVKRATVALEDTYPVGRLWDLDVHDGEGDGAVGRSVLGLAPRRCLVCDAPGHACARSRAHTLAETTAAMEALHGRPR